MINEFWNLLRFYSADRFIFTAFELFIVMTFIYAWWQEGRRAGAVVTRGEESWQSFAFTYGIISVVLAEVVNVSAAYSEHKVIFVIFNLLATLYLCFYSSWFRNKIIGLISKSKQKKEF